MKYIIVRHSAATIHSIHSKEEDLVINFPKNSIYAVVPTNFYGFTYTTHRSADTAIAASLTLSDIEHEIIDKNGIRYVISNDGYNSVLIKR